MPYIFLGFFLQKKKKGLSYIIPSMSKKVYISELPQSTQVSLGRIMISIKVS